MSDDNTEVFDHIETEAKKHGVEVSARSEKNIQIKGANTHAVHMSARDKFEHSHVFQTAKLSNGSLMISASKRSGDHPAVSGKAIQSTYGKSKLGLGARYTPGKKRW